VAQSEVVKTRSDADARRAEARAAVLAIDRTRAENLAAERARDARLASLRRERANLDGDRLILVSTVARFEQEAERRRIRAPISGRLGEVTLLQVGAVVREGDRLASVIPGGRVHVAAEFAPTAVGRIRPGQAARLRLDGFPWLQYGRVPATVTRVASEPRDQRVRVEFALGALPDLPVAVQHGLPGTVEVEVERVAPAVLVMRAVGYALAVGDAKPRPEVTTTTTVTTR
jgi:membrane fusion protein (multidrug efflux system)